MSTKLSGDLLWEKSSTRRFAPPGGQSSISLGDYNPLPSPPAPPTENGVTQSAVTPTRRKPRVSGSAATDMAMPSPGSTGSQLTPPLGAGIKVGVAVCEAAGLKAATVAALKRLGATPTVYEVSDPLQLPFAAQCMIDNKGVAAVVAIGFLVADAHWCCKEVAGALVKTLLDLSLQLKVPVINGLCFSLVMESDLNALGGRLARGAMNMAAVREGAKESYSVSRAYPAVPNTSSRSIDQQQPENKSSVFQPTRSVPNDLHSLLLGLRTALKAHGAKGMFGLARRFRISDSDKSGSISFHEFQVCMRDMHMDWTEDELKNVFEYFDTDRSKAINYEEFLFAVQGEVNERRAQLILEAFEVMDKDKSGIVNRADLVGVYDASKHPDVVQRRRSEDEIMEEFLSTFEGEIKDGKVTPEEWCRYYAMLSASITNDDEFELMMRNAWHLPGGKGPLTNTSARRVLATRADGSQTVEEVKNAVGPAGVDKRTILQSLRSRGLGVTSVELFGKVETVQPPIAQSAEKAEPERFSNERSTYLVPVRQGPGGNSSLVLG